MNDNNFIKKLITRLNAGNRAAQSKPVMQMNNGRMGGLFQMLARTEETELSCDDVFRLLDEYADVTISGEDAASLLPLVKLHLDNCMDCREEYETLIQILKDSTQISS
jgi:hypothetical protein